MLRWLFIFWLSNLVYALPNVRIIGGQDAVIMDYPWQVSIRHHGAHFCGGSILTAYFILTAAHCTDGYTSSDLTVRAGSSYSNRGGNTYQVESIFQHPSYVSKKEDYDYDIAVLKLKAPLQFGLNVRSIRMASTGTIVETGRLGTATGWGTTQPNGTAPSIQLQSVVLPYISLADCRQYYKGNLTERMFCAGFEIGGKDTCQGDSGGPYVVSGILLGITSWGYVCAAPKQPGVFADIVILRDFVDKIVV